MTFQAYLLESKATRAKRYGKGFRKSFNFRQVSYRFGVCFRWCQCILCIAAQGRMFIFSVPMALCTFLLTSFGDP